MTPRTRAGLAQVRPVRPGGRVALVAPSSPFDRAQFDAGLTELRRLGFTPVYDETIFEREAIVAGPAARRAHWLEEYAGREDIDAVMAVRGGYGSAETLPLLSAERLASRRTAFVGYSDVTAIHMFLAFQAGLASVHGPMIEGRLAVGPAAYDPASFLAALLPEPVGALAPEGVEVVRPGDVEGPLLGGTMTQIVSSLGTPFAFAPPPGFVLLLDEIGERPYRLRRMLTQLQQSGVLARAAAVVVGQLPGCDEPGGAVTGRGVVADFFQDFPGPVLAGFPTGHTTTPLVTLPLGVATRVVARQAPVVVVTESAAAD